MSILSFDLGDFNAESAWLHVDETTGTLSRGTVLTTSAALEPFLREQRPTTVLCEACLMTAVLMDAVNAALPGVPVLAANTNADAWRWTKTKCKTDPKDCERLIRLHRVGELQTVRIPCRRDREFRRMLYHRGNLVERRTALYNSIRSACKRHEVILPAGQAAWKDDGLAMLETLAKASSGSRQLDDEAIWRIEVGHSLSQLRLLNTQIDQVEAIIHSELDRRPEAQRLLSIPGVGPQLAAFLLAFIGDPKRFKTGKQVAAYCGLAPRIYQSGKTERSGHITKAGNVRLRKILVNVAWLARRYNPWARELFDRLVGNSKSKARRKVAIVAVARRLVIRCWALWRDGTTWQHADAVPA